ncbi:MAG: hypothetical protein H7318_12895 [Oligoflexus sp.]|nr:hypothetical protein [Oligoflexus sp.]
MSSKQYDQSHLVAKRRCSNLRDFLDGFEVAIGRVYQRASEESGESQAVRRSIGSKDIAGVILQGTLNYDRCETKLGFRKIAIEASFKELTVSSEDGTQCALSDVQVRIVIKDLASGGKMIVVSYYKLYSEEEKEGLQEVDYEKIW